MVNEIIEWYKIVNEEMNKKNVDKYGAPDANKALVKKGITKDDGGKKLRNNLRKYHKYLPPEYKKLIVNDGNWWFYRNKQTVTSTPIKEKEIKVVSSQRNKLSFQPLLCNNPKVLILGTLPGEESLRQQQYYAKKGNRFWETIAAVFNETEPTNYEDKKSLLARHNIALWDIVHNAQREGSSDSNIINEEPNDIKTLIEENPSIELIVFNGQKAEKLFNKYFDTEDFDVIFKTAYSTSGANRQFNSEQMKKDWEIISKV